MKKTDRSVFGPRLVLGVAAIFFGLMLTLDRMDMLDAGDIFLYWPLALVAIGATRLGRRELSDLVFSLVFIGAGLWILLFNLEIIDLEPWSFFWPIILILLGINLTMGALRRYSVSSDAAATVNALAFLSGVDRKNDSAEFRGADLTAVMGGCDLDLRQARISEGRPVIQVFAFWGGIDIRVPPDWAVDSRVLPLLGSYEDTREQISEAADAPRVVIKGMAVMGGVEVKN